MADNPTDYVVTDAMLIAGGEAATKAGMEYSRYADIEAIYLAMSQASPLPLSDDDSFLREIYSRAFDEGAESTIEQWKAEGNYTRSPMMPHKDCKSEGSYQFVEDMRPRFAALTASRMGGDE